MKTKNVILILMMYLLGISQLQSQNVFLIQQKLVDPCRSDSSKVFFQLDTIGSNLLKPITILWSDGSNGSCIYSKVNNKIWIRISDAGAKVFSDTLIIQSATKPLLSYDVVESASCRGDGSILFYTNDGSLINRISFQNIFRNGINNDSVLISNLGSNTYLGDSVFIGSCVYTIEPIYVPEYSFQDFWIKSQETSNPYTRDGIIEFSKASDPCRVELWYNATLQDQRILITGENDYVFDGLMIGNYVVSVVDKYNCSVSKNIDVLAGNSNLFEVADSYRLNSSYMENKTLIVKQSAGIVYDIEIIDAVGNQVFKSSDYENEPLFVFTLPGTYYLIIRSDILTRPIKKVLKVN